MTENKKTKKSTGKNVDTNKSDKKQEKKVIKTTKAKQENEINEESIEMISHQEQTAEIKTETINENKKNITTVQITVVIVAVIAILVVLFLLLNSKNTYKLSDISQYSGINETITLPKNCYASKDGNIFIKEGKFINLKGHISLMEADESSYNDSKSYYGAYYDIVDFDDIKGYKFVEIYNEDYYDCIFILKDNYLLNIYLINTDEKLELEIINSLK